MTPHFKLRKQGLRGRDHFYLSLKPEVTQAVLSSLNGFGPDSWETINEGGACP